MKIQFGHMNLDYCKVFIICKKIEKCKIYYMKYSFCECMYLYAYILKQKENKK